MSTTTPPDLETYRLDARRWLSENLPRLQAPVGLRDTGELGDYTDDVIEAARVVQRKLYDAGYAGITWPEEYGGQGLPGPYEMAFLEEAEGYSMPDFGSLGGTTYHICAPVMIEHAQPEFLRTFIPRVLAGDALICQFFSEPMAGSDLAASRTRAVRDGEQWVINGQKIWSTFAQFADWGMCLARTDWDVPKHRGLTWFAVPCDAKGLAIRPIRQINGSSRFCEDFFDDVVVPDVNRIGTVNDGWTVTQTMLVRERGAARSEDALRLPAPGPLAPDLVEVARTAGRTRDPIARQKLARAHTNDYVGRALAWRIAQLGRTENVNTGVAAYGKLFRGTYNPIRARIGVEIGGPGALVWNPADNGGDATSKAYLTGRLRAIAGGTNEMQRNAIGERVLGLPREPSFDTTKPFNEVLRDAKSWSGKV
jgi:alkylation response protein AidB-like acyl-CoA dehydrogenase